MGKHHIKCLVCGCEKDNYPELKFFKIPENRERRRIWLSSFDKTHLINANISGDLRICQRHFSYDMFAKSKLRLKRKAIPIKEIVSAKRVIILQDIQLTPPISPRDTNIGGNMIKGIMDELPGNFNMLNFDTTQKSTQKRSLVENSEIEINKLRLECEELRRQIAELKKLKDSDKLYIERMRRILPLGISFIVESHIKKLHRNRQGWRYSTDFN